VRNATMISGILFALAAIFVIRQEPTPMETAIRTMVPSGTRCTSAEQVKVWCEYAPGLSNELSVKLIRNGTTEILINPAQKTEAYIGGIQAVHQLQGFNADEVSTCLRDAVAKRSIQEIDHKILVMNCWVDIDGALAIHTQKSHPF
jgi:hypothetical protein